MTNDTSPERKVESPPVGWRWKRGDHCRGPGFWLLPELEKKRMCKAKAVEKGE